MRNWVIWFHLLHIFPAELLLLLRLTYLSSRSSHQDCAASYVPDCCLCLLQSSCILQGVWRAQIKVRVVLQLTVSLLTSSKRLPLPQWGYLLGTGKGTRTRGDLHSVMQHVYHREENSQLGCPSTVPTSPDCSAFLLILLQLLVSLFLYSRQHNTQQPLQSRVLFSLFPKNLLKNLPDLLWSTCQFGGCV